MPNYRVTMDTVDVEAATPEDAIQVAITESGSASFRVVELLRRETSDLGKEIPLLVQGTVRIKPPE